MSDQSQAPHGVRMVLVSGGAGFIGSHLVDALVVRGLKVRVLDNLATGKQPNVNPAAEFVAGDIRDRSTIEGAFAGVDCVFHTAAMPRVGLSIDKPVETHMANVIGTLNVMMAARDAGVRRVIYSGSSSVYGGQATLPLSESIVPNPLSPYALQKLVGEQYVRMFHRLFGIEALCLRYFSVYGPRMDLEGGYATVIGAFIRSRLGGEPLRIFGDGEQTRDFTEVRDVVRANVAAMDCPSADGRAINVGRGRNLSVNRIADIIGGPRVTLPARPGEPHDTLADVSRAREILGWEPEIDAEDGVRELMRLYGL